MRTVGACLSHIGFVALVGCSGTIAGDDLQEGTPVRPSAAAPGMKPAPGAPSEGIPPVVGPGMPMLGMPMTTPPPGSPAACLPVAGTTAMRRLSRGEYNNVVRDLLGTALRPADQFQTDDGFAGFETNGPAPLVRLQTERYMDTAEALAAKADLSKILPCPPAAGDEACAQLFIERFGKRAYRRPLDQGEKDRALQVFRDKRMRGGDFAAAIRLVVAAFLQSPSFLYRPELALAAKPGPVTGAAAYELASRLSFFLWATMPDDKLLVAAESGAFNDRPKFETEVRRMVADAKATDAFQSFHRQWLGAPRLDTVVKDEKRFPDWSPALRTSMKEETRRFVDHVFREGGASFSTMLTAGYSFVDATTAKLYGVLPPASGFARVEMPAGQRSGVLTHGAFLATQALADQGSPIHRGLFVREQLLCAHVPEPPSGVDITPPKVDDSRPSRERFEAHRKDPQCAGCHQLMDPLGFGFQRYDAIGKWQDLDGKFPVDDKGEIVGVGADVDGPFKGALELTKKLAAAPTTQACMARQWMRFGLGRMETDAESCLMSQWGAGLASNKLDLKELLVAIATSDTFRLRRAPN